MKKRKDTIRVMDITTGQAKTMTFDEYLDDLVKRDPDNFTQKLNNIINNIREQQRKFHEGN
jgi:hypothetical protein